MPQAFKNIRPNQSVSCHEIRKQLNISRDLVQHLIEYLEIVPIKTIDHNGKILKYYSPEALDLCRDFLDHHPDTRSFFGKLNHQNNPEKYTKARGKAAKTIQERYHVDNISKVSGMAQRKLDSFYAHHNQSFSSYMKQQAPHSWNKRVETLERKFGKDFRSELARRRLAGRTLETSRQATETRKKTCLDKYGVDNPILVPEIAAKAKEGFRRRNAEIIEEISRLGGITEKEIRNQYQISDPAFRYHTEAAGISIKNHKGYNYILRSELERISETLRCIPTVKSAGEDSLKKFIQSILPGDTELLSNKRILPDGREVDIWIPDLHLAVEFNGLYWHSESCGKGPAYHLSKTQQCCDLGIRLIQIFEDEWLYKREICQSILRSAVGVSPVKISARLCQVRPVSPADYRSFMNQNHIQGCGPLPKIAIGLLYQNELIQAVGFGHSRYKKDEFELYRMASKLNTTVVGGFSKLLAHCPLNSFVSYVDRRLFTGEGYQQVGFQFIGTSKPSYFYVRGLARYNRLEYQKHKLSKKLEIFDPTKTEKENMLANGFQIIYDCGTYKVKWQRNSDTK